MGRYKFAGPVPFSGIFLFNEIGDIGDHYYKYQKRYYYTDRIDRPRNTSRLLQEFFVSIDNYQTCYSNNSCCHFELWIASHIGN